MSGEDARPARAAAGSAGADRPAADGPSPGRPSFLRRLAAVVYDALLLFAVLFAATAALLPFTGGEAIEPNHPGYTAYLLLVSFAYFGWVWTHGGQTLGARAWRLRVRRAGGGKVRWRDALARFVVALLGFGALGLGFLWALFDPRGHALHDRLSSTEVELLPKGG